MEDFLSVFCLLGIGAFFGWFVTSLFGWTRRAHYEYKEFLRGVQVGRNHPLNTVPWPIVGDGKYNSGNTTR